MPVDKNEWDSGRKWESLEARILTFLQNNRDQGFTVVEIYRGLGYQFARPLEDPPVFILGVAMVSVIQNALETLVKEGTVKAKIIKGKIGEETYYMVAPEKLPSEKKFRFIEGY